MAADDLIDQIPNKSPISPFVLLARVFALEPAPLPGLSQNQWGLESNCFEDGWLQFRALDLLFILLDNMIDHQVRSNVPLMPCLMVKAAFNFCF